MLLCAVVHLRRAVLGRQRGRGPCLKALCGEREIEECQRV